MRICDWKSSGVSLRPTAQRTRTPPKEVTRLCRLGLPSLTIGEYGVWNILTSEVVKLEEVETHSCSRRSCNQLLYSRQTASRWITQSKFPQCGANFVHRRKDLQVEHDGLAAERIQGTEAFSEEDIALEPWLRTSWDAFHLYLIAQGLFHYFAEDTKASKTVFRERRLVVTPSAFSASVILWIERASSNPQ